MEIELINAVLRTEERHSLYQMHFTLFNLLYGLRNREDMRGYHLHISSLRISLTPIPSTGCMHFYHHAAAYCGAPASGRFCAEHQHEENQLEFEPMGSFYSDPVNLHAYSEETIRAMIEGFHRYAAAPRAVDSALKLFGLTHPDPIKLRIAYRRLAMRYHPDQPRGDAETMKEINAAYTLLKTVYPASL
jgi:hypothetical protein